MKNKLIIVIIIQALTNVILFGLLAACHNRKVHKSWIELHYPTNMEYQATLPEPVAPAPEPEPKEVKTNLPPGFRIVCDEKGNYAFMDQGWDISRIRAIAYLTGIVSTNQQEAILKAWDHYNWREREKTNEAAQSKVVYYDFKECAE